MRVGLSTSVIQRGHTGIGRYVLSLVQAVLEQRALELVLFVFEQDVPLFEFATDRVSIVRVPERFRPAARDILWHQTVLPRLAQQQRLDILHVPSYRRMLWTRACTLVATIHDLAPFHLKDKYDWKRMLYARVGVRHLAQRQSAIIAISENTARDVRRFLGVPPERIHVIHNGIDHERFRPGSQVSDISRRHGLNQPFFLYVARLEHPGKNHLRLLEAFDRFKTETGSRWQLALAGSDWHGAEAIHAAIARSPYATDIRCLGFVADSELPSLYSAAGAFVYPSLFEGFGLPPVEAMACGIPVLCSTRGALGEVVADAALTVDPENVSAIRTALVRIATDENLRAQLRARGLERARRFTWSGCAQATIETYKRLLQRPTRAHVTTPPLTPGPNPASV